MSTVSEKLPEVRVVESYIEVISAVLHSMSANIAFPMFAGSLMIKFEDLRDSFDNFRVEFIHNLKFDKYE